MPRPEKGSNSPLASWNGHLARSAQSSPLWNGHLARSGWSVERARCPFHVGSSVERARSTRAPTSANGYDGYVRKTPDKLTQDFLATLPEKWRKESLKLDVSGINEDGPSDEELAEHGLVPKVRNVWSLAEE